MHSSTSSALLNSSSSIDDHVDVYLSLPRYTGRSAYKHSGVLKKAGGRWDSEKKKWYAPNKTVLLELLETEVWTPDADIDASQMRSVLSQRAEAARREAHAKECEARRRKGPTDEQAEGILVKDLDIKPSTPEELEELKRWGVTEPLLQLSIKDCRLGPRGSLSPAMRLLMGLRAGYMTPSEIGKYTPGGKRRQQEETATGTTAQTAKRSKKLPTLPAFQKRSFSVPSGNGGVQTQKKSNLALPSRPNQVFPSQSESRTMLQVSTSTCKSCGKTYMMQFPCECVETKEKLGI